MAVPKVLVAIPGLGLLAAAGLLFGGSAAIAAPSSATHPHASIAASSKDDDENKGGDEDDEDNDSDDNPRNSSFKHDHDKLECKGSSKIKQSNGKCDVEFSEKDESEPTGQQVCFSVSPSNAGTVTSDVGGSCTTVKSDKDADGTFHTSGTYCGKATITATEPAESNQQTQTTIKIVCTGQ